MSTVEPRNDDCEHDWRMEWRKIRIPVVRGIAVMPNGVEVHSMADEVEWAEVVIERCQICGAYRDVA